MQNYVPSGSNMQKSLYYKNMTDMNSSAICKLPCSTRELYGYLFILKVLLLCRTFLVSLSILTIEASGFFFLLPTLLQSTNGSCYLKQCYLFACNNRQRHLNFTCVFKHFSSDETIIMVTQHNLDFGNTMLLCDFFFPSTFYHSTLISINYRKNLSKVL